MKFSNLLQLFLLVFILIGVSQLFGQNYALQFDGVDDYVQLTNANLLGLTNTSFTVENWMNITFYDGNDETFFGAKGMGELHFVVRDQKPYLGFYNNDLPGNTFILTGLWYHITWRYRADIQEQAIFVNGELDTSETGHPPYQSNDTLAFGRWENSNFLNGYIDEVRIWDTALTQSEIQANMYRKVTDYEPGLVGYWPFNEGVGDTVFDYSGLDNHGIIHGASWVPSSAPNGLTFFFAHPNIAYQNHPLSTSFRGTNTHFADSTGTSNVWLSRGDTTLLTQNFTVNSNTSLDAFFSIPADAPAGFWGIKIETAIDSIITMNNGMEILSPPALFPQNSGTSTWLKGISATDDLHAWAVGNQGTIVSTTDGGETWTLQNSGTTNTLNAVCFSDINSGWAVGQSGLIIQTTNGGIDWTPQNSGTSNNLQSVSFTDAITGWAVGSNGSILKTIDGGVTWSQQNSGISTWLYAVCFTDANHGWAAGSNGTILYTTDGGVIWIAQSSGISEYLFSLHFTDVTTGWAVGSGGTILNTTDGGSSWVPQNSGTASWLRSVYFMNADTGFAVGNSGTYLMTTDGGGVWDSRRSMTGNTLNGLSFASHNTGWIVGEAGIIMKLTFQGVLTSIDDATIANFLKPDRFQLLQNYPNPFNPNTTISYRLPKRSEVILKVYNLLGQEVRTLVNTIQWPGEHKVAWDGKDQFERTVSSGIYVYSLQSENYFDSRKMLFLK